MRVTPVPIPNTEVKPHTADGTAWETVWESRSLPALFNKARELVVRGLFSCPPAVSFVRRVRLQADRHGPPEGGPYVLVENAL